MRDPMFLILKSLSMFVKRFSKIILFVFENFFPSPTPEEPEDQGLNGLLK